MRKLLAYAHYVFVKENCKEELEFANEFLFKPIVYNLNSFISHLRYLRSIFLPSNTPPDIRHSIVHAPFFLVTCGILMQFVVFFKIENFLFALSATTPTWAGFFDQKQRQRKSTWQGFQTWWKRKKSPRRSILFQTKLNLYILPR